MDGRYQYVDSSEFQFEKGVLEYYDTATSTVRRNATPEELKDAKRKRKAAERKGEALLKKKTRPGDGSTALQLQKQLEHQNCRVSVISHPLVHIVHSS